jgi:RimJ/RimL family protein N-acetyltransferase
MFHIPANTTLTGSIVQLLPMLPQHFDELTALAKDARIWQHYVFDGTNSANFNAALQAGLAEKEKGAQFPFVIYHVADKKLIGGTRYLDIQPAHRKLEIGWTWLHPDYWGTPVNLECKLLLLTFAFEQLQAARVQLKTDENNIRSRKAIEKIGGRFEGILRNDMLRENGTHRNSAYYSILDTEWPEAKKQINALLHPVF